MEKVLGFLKGIFYIATEDGDQARVRPFDGGTEYEGKLYFGTASNKNVYKQLVANPKFEIFAMGDAGTMRLTGVAQLEEDPKKAEAVFQEMGKYGSGNPMLAAFYIEKGEAVVTGVDGNEETVTIGA